MRGRIVAQLVLAFVAAGCGSTASREYTSPEGRYRVQFPGKPKITEQTVPTPVGPIITKVASTKDWSRTERMVMYADFPGGLIHTGNKDRMLDGACQGMATEANLVILSKTPIAMNGHPGREVSFETQEGHRAGKMTGRARIYLVGDRLYQVFIAGPTGRITPETMESFLDSFELLDQGPDRAARPGVPRGPESRPARLRRRPSAARRSAAKSVARPPAAGRLDGGPAPGRWASTTSPSRPPRRSRPTSRGWARRPGRPRSRAWADRRPAAAAGAPRSARSTGSMPTRTSWAARRCRPGRWDQGPAFPARARPAAEHDHRVAGDLRRAGRNRWVTQPSDQWWPIAIYPERAAGRPVARRAGRRLLRAAGLRPVYQHRHRRRVRAAPSSWRSSCRSAAGRVTLTLAVQAARAGGRAARRRPAGPRPADAPLPRSPRPWRPFRPAAAEPDRPRRQPAAQPTTAAARHRPRASRPRSRTSSSHRAAARRSSRSTGSIGTTIASGTAGRRIAPGGGKDEHFRLVMDLPAAAIIEEVAVTGGGPVRWTTKPTRPLLAARRRRQPASSRTAPRSLRLGAFSGRWTFDLYAESQDGVRPDQAFGVEVVVFIRGTRHHLTARCQRK